MGDIRSVEPLCVVFNWECCSTCAHEAFHQPDEDPRCREIVMDLMQLLLERGHMVMCSDFSLKALIKQWSERRLGPNPFVKIGDFGGSFQLHFDPDVLAQCPSSQLQKAGEMSSDGSARLHAMSNTIASSQRRALDRVVEHRCNRGASPARGGGLLRRGVFRDGKGAIREL